MLIIVLLISVSITIAVTFLLIFYWNIRSGQYDDTYTPSVRILFEDKKQIEGSDTKEETLISGGSAEPAK